MGDNGNAQLPSLVLLGNIKTVVGVPLGSEWELSFHPAPDGLALQVGGKTGTTTEVWTGPEAQCGRVLGALCDDLHELNVGASWQVISLQLRDPLPPPP